MQAERLPGGAWPVMVTPFLEDRSIDWTALDALIEWYLAAGVGGLFAVAQTSEMYALSAQERRALAERVVQRVAGRVPVVACGSFGRDFAEQLASVHEMATTGVAAVVAVTSQIAGLGESDAVLGDRLVALAEAARDVALGLYECPLPYKRLLSAELVAELARTGVFSFYKDTSEQPSAVGAKAAATENSPLGIYNAEMSSLLESLRLGARGFSGNAGNYYPELVQWLCDAGVAGDERAEEVQLGLSVADAVVSSPLYPASAKHFLARQRGLPILPVCRVTNVGLSAHDLRLLEHLHRHMQTIDLPVRLV